MRTNWRNTIFVFAFLISSFSFAHDWSGVYRSSRSSIPLLYTRGGFCSGALITDQLILTAAHCVQTLRQVHVIWPEDHKQLEPADIVAMDIKNDLALVRLRKATARVPLKVLAKNEKLEPGQEVATIGHPTFVREFRNPIFDMDSTYLISSGIISSVLEKEVLIDASVSPGNSGGPLLDTKGRVVGVISRKRIEFRVGSISWAPHHQSIQKFLETSAEKTSPLPVSQARGTPGISLGFSEHNLGRSSKMEHLWLFSVSYDVWDRVRLQASNSFNSSDIDFSSYGIGYKFLFSFSNLASLSVVPSWNHFEYVFKPSGAPNISSDANGPSVSIGYSSIPIGLRYSTFVLDGHRTSVTTLTIGF